MFSSSMTLKQTIRELNRNENGVEISRLVDSMRRSTIRFMGIPVHWTYADIRDCFMRCDPSIDAARFEELMQLADYAPGSA